MPAGKDGVVVVWKKDFCFQGMSQLRKSDCYTPWVGSRTLIYNRTIKTIMVVTIHYLLKLPQFISQTVILASPNFCMLPKIHKIRIMDVPLFQPTPVSQNIIQNFLTCLSNLWSLAFCLSSKTPHVHLSSPITYSLLMTRPTDCSYWTCARSTHPFHMPTV